MEDKKRSSKHCCVRVLISGIVQGVGYRFSTRQKAQKLGVKGWVRNLPDSRVEAVFCGEKTALEAILKWCEEGPTAAVVKEVKVEPIETQILIDKFKIR